MNNTKPRFHVRNRYILFLDLGLTAGSVLAAFALRLEAPVFVYYLPAIYWMIGLSLVIKPTVYFLFGLYRRLWAYASTNELRLIVSAVTVGSAIVSVLMFALLATKLLAGFPRTALAIDWILSLIGIGGFRFMIRVLAESRVAAAISAKQGKKRQVLVIGAGDAGAMVVREMKRSSVLNFEPVGYLDDDKSKQKHSIHGVPVVGTLGDLARVLDNRRVDEVVIAIPSASGRVVRMVTDICRLKAIPFRTMPGLYELIGGKVSVNRLRDVDITDLLRRAPAQMDTELVGATLSGKRILVTGAGGSIGRELCRQIARWEPAELCLLGHGENSIFEVVLEIKEDFPSLSITPVIADVRDLARLNSIFEKYAPHVVFHAAAHKHVPLMESNIEDAITNNIIGTRNVVQAASSNNVERLVMISTDKAVRPVNVMGATKRMAEMIVLDMAIRTKCPYSVVRFGNVLGSRGSVVPLFKHQIAQGGPVTITHPDMKRYFMTIPEAVHLVLQAAAMGKNGDVFLLNMGQQVRILDLAEDLIRLSGLEPGKDIEITFTGIRPGEKLSEDLWEDGTQYQNTDHPDIYRAEEDILDHDTLYKAVEELFRLAQDGEATAILEMMDSVIPSAAIQATPSPDLTSIV